MNEIKLTKLQSYIAMFYFLEHLYELTNDEGIGMLLGSMRILDDGKPADPAYWTDWEVAVGKASKS